MAKKNNKNFLKKEIIAWVILIIILFSVSTYFGRNSGAPVTTVPYSEFIDRVNSGDVTSVEIKMKENYPSQVIGTLKDGSFIESYPPGNIDALESNLIEKDVTYDVKPNNSTFWMIFWNIAPWILIIGVWWFFMQKMMQGAGGGANQAFSFGKSKAKLFLDNKPRVTFKDVAGVEEVKDELKEIIEFLKNPKKFAQFGAKIPKGVLLLGPPGCGKTLIARAVSGEAKVPFFSVSGSEFVEMFVGVGASRVRDLFKQAKTYGPCIIFIDEIDAVGRHRGAGIGGGHDEREQTLNQLLVEMDGFDPHTGIIVMAATNRPDILDTALLRPGRFDRRIVVGLPTLKDREEILKVHGKKKTFAKEVNFKSIAQQTPGFTGADLENLLNEAALLGIRKNKKEISQQEIEEAVDKVIAGPEKKSLILSEEEKRAVAIHETGHAIVNTALPTGDIVHRISIVSRGMALGYNLQLPERDKYLQKKSELMNKISALLGGRAAEEVMLHETSTGAANDLERATNIARKMVRAYGMSDKLGPITFGKHNEMIFLGKELGEERDYSETTANLIDAEVKKIIETSYEKAKLLIEKQLNTVMTITNALLEKETLQGEELKKYLSLVKKEKRELQKNIPKVFQLLRNEFGAQNWWPGETPFEVMVGAVLTQQTSWKNVEKAINNLREEGVLSPFSLNKISIERIKQLIKPAGFYNIKTERLKALTEYFIEQYNGSISRMQKNTVTKLRKELLSIKGIGRETADSILLYALDKKIFVVDAYTIRMMHRTEILNITDYDKLRKIFETNLKKYKINGYSTVDVFKEMHALIVELGKRYCKKIPVCDECPLNKMCKKKGV